MIPSWCAHVDAHDGWLGAAPELPRERMARASTRCAAVSFPDWRRSGALAGADAGICRVGSAMGRRGQPAASNSMRCDASEGTPLADVAAWEMRKQRARRPETGGRELII